MFIRVLKSSCFTARNKVFVAYKYPATCKFNLFLCSILVRTIKVSILDWEVNPDCVTVPVSMSSVISLSTQDVQAESKNKC